MKKLEIIKYHNDLKSVNINHLTLQESKIFIKLIQEVQNKQDELLKIPFSDFQNILNQNYTLNELVDLIENSTKKAISSYITITNKEKNEVTIFSFFTRFKIFLNEKMVEAQVNKDFLYLINELIKNYSTLFLSEVIQFKSKYSLLMYKKIREFYKQERLELNIDTFKEYLGIQKANIRFINLRVLNQVNKELPKIFKNFSMEKVKKGREISKYIFT